MTAHGLDLYDTYLEVDASLSLIFAIHMKQMLYCLIRVSIE